MGNKLTQIEINKIIENHKHWLNEDVDGWDNMKANFSNQDLSYANLSGANLHGADLGGADLSHANLNYANLRNANLNYANLSHADLSDADINYAYLNYANLNYANLSDVDFCGTDLRNANLSYANLSGANLHGADLSYANLSRTNLRGTNLSYASLCGADISYANLSGTDLSDADLSDADLLGAKNMMYIPMACPEEGSFIGFKKAVYANKDYIVKLEISVDARRSSATSRKCRCDKAKVLEIQNLDGSKANIDVVYSAYDPSFQYKTGQIVEEPKYDDNRFNVCSKGIHFFINRQEAVDF
jgi:uncharacterized protein YjbI with pentapeptide repeats